VTFTVLGSTPIPKKNPLNIVSSCEYSQGVNPSCGTLRETPNVTSPCSYTLAVKTYKPSKKPCDTFALPGGSQYFSVFVSGSVQSTKNTDIQGRLAADGNILFGSSIGSQIDGPTTNTKSCFDLDKLAVPYSVVGGGTTQISGAVYGPPAVSFAFSGQPASYQCGYFTQSPPPIDFGTAFNLLEDTSDALVSLTPTGTVLGGRTCTLFGSDSTVQEVFDTTAAVLGQCQNFALLNIKPDVKGIVINVYGNVGLTIKSANFQALEPFASRIIWNIDPAITSISLSSVQFYGTILAPDSSFEGFTGELQGQLIANSYYGNIQINLPLFDGCFVFPIALNDV